MIKTLDTNSPLHIDNSGFMVEKIIGQGGNSVVYSCKNPYLAAKCLPYKNFFPWTEIYLTCSPYIVHPNVNKGNMGNTAHEGLFLYQERATYSLKDFINNTNHNISIELKYECIKQIVSGVLYLHENGFIHCDLKPSNILVFPNSNLTDLILKSQNTVVFPNLTSLGSQNSNKDPNTNKDTNLSTYNTNKDPNSFRVSDFGLSTKYEWYHPAKIGSSKYRAPECEKEGWDEKIDVWGLGQILFFILAGEDLFNNTEGVKSYKNLYLSDLMFLEIKTYIKSRISSLCGEAGGEVEPNTAEINDPDSVDNELFVQLCGLCEKMLAPNTEERITLVEISDFFKIKFIPYQHGFTSTSASTLASTHNDRSVKDVFYKQLLSHYEGKDLDKKKKLANNIVRQMISGMAPNLYSSYSHNYISYKNLIEEIFLFMKIVKQIKL